MMVIYQLAVQVIQIAGKEILHGIIKEPVRVYGLYGLGLSLHGT